MIVEGTRQQSKARQIETNSSEHCCNETTKEILPDAKHH